MDRCEMCGTFGLTVDGVLCESCEAQFWGEDFDESDREYEIQFGHTYL